MEATPVAVEEATAVVRVLVRYGEPARQEYLDLWVMHFADDERVDDFDEWAYGPGKSYSAAPIDLHQGADRDRHVKQDAL